MDVHTDPRICRKHVGALWLGAIACGVFVSSGSAAINLEFRPGNQSAAIGQQVDIQLFAVSDDQTNQLLSAIQLVFTWEPVHLTLLGNSTAGAPSMAYSGFPTSGHYGLNELAIPQDGDAFYLALSFSAISATPGGTLMTTLQFNAISATVMPSRIGMLAEGGLGGQTIVASGSVPGLNVTGTLTDAFVQINVPAPGIGVVFCGGIWAHIRRKRRREKNG